MGKHRAEFIEKIAVLTVIVDSTVQGQGHTNKATGKVCSANMDHATLNDHHHTSIRLGTKHALRMPTRMKLMPDVPQEEIAAQIASPRSSTLDQARATVLKFRSKRTSKHLPRAMLVRI